MNSYTGANRLVISASSAQYAPTEKADSLTTLPLQKIAEILFNLLALSGGRRNCQSIGLLQAGTADWLAFGTRGVAHPHFLEQLQQRELDTHS